MNKKAKHAGGRPPFPEGEATDAVLSVRLTPRELEDIKTLAERAGVAPSKFARSVLLEALRLVKIERP